MIQGIKRFFTKPGEFRKGYAALATDVGLVVSSGFVHGTVQHELIAAIPILNLIGVILFRNDQKS